MADLDDTGDILYATGSHQVLGPPWADNDVSLAETSPNYFERGRCDGLYSVLTVGSFLHIDNWRDTTSTPSSPGTWSPQAAATIQDLAGSPARG